MTKTQRTRTPRRLTDVRELRAVAHPARVAILEHLTVDGPLTASQLGDRLGQSPANCSWHLRKLAEHGFVEEAEGGTGRQRPWRSAERGMSWNEGDESPEARIAGQELTRTLLSREVDRLLASQDRAPDEPPQWRDAAEVTQSLLWLTAEELRDINSQIQHLVLSRIDRLDDPESRPEGSRLCAFMAWGVPAYDIKGGVTGA